MVFALIWYQPHIPVVKEHRKIHINEPTDSNIFEPRIHTTSVAVECQTTCKKPIMIYLESPLTKKWLNFFWREDHDWGRPPDGPASHVVEVVSKKMVIMALFEGEWVRKHPDLKVIWKHIRKDLPNISPHIPIG